MSATRCRRDVWLKLASQKFGFSIVNVTALQTADSCRDQVANARENVRVTATLCRKPLGEPLQRTVPTHSCPAQSSAEQHNPLWCKSGIIRLHAATADLLQVSWMHSRANQLGPYKCYLFFWRQTCSAGHFVRQAADAFPLVTRLRPKPGRCLPAFGSRAGLKQQALNGVYTTATVEMNYYSTTWTWMGVLAPFRLPCQFLETCYTSYT